MGLLSRKITYSSSSLETNRLVGEEDGAREIYFYLTGIIFNILIKENLSGMITYNFLFLLCVSAEGEKK